MKYALLFGVTVAVQNLEGNTCESIRSCWAGTEVKYQEPWPFCIGDNDCEDEHYCMNFKWTYNSQQSSGKGCWRSDLCAGSGTYTMFNERTIQWFCTEEQHAAQEGKPAPWNLERIPEKYWDEWSPACKTTADCPNPELGQVCTNMYWDAVIDGSSFANGEACYNWAAPVCPGSTFG